MVFWRSFPLLLLTSVMAPPLQDIVADRGEGCHVWDTSGTRYLDFTSGIGVTSTGHCHPRVVNAIQQQASRMIFAQQNVLPATPITFELVQRLKEIIPYPMTRYFFCNSGSEAVDNAMKLARAATGRKNIITFLVSGCYLETFMMRFATGK